jgi:hypothetical protein
VETELGLSTEGGGRMGKAANSLDGLYGKPTPLTGACARCGVRVRLKKDGTVWRHGRTSRKPTACPGSGMVPKPGTAIRKWPPRKTSHGRSIRAVSGGAVESSRRRH